MASRRDPRLDFEYVTKWKTSLKTLLETLEGRNMFRKFLKWEYSEETLNFYLAVKDLKMEKDGELIKKMCVIIYDRYIREGCDEEITIGYGTRKQIEKDMEAPNKSMFDKAQDEQFVFMAANSLPRFVKSDLYVEFLNDYQLQYNVAHCGLD